MTLNFERARQNMVEQQVRPWDVLDSRILELFETVHREDFVPTRHRKLALADLAIPLEHGQFMMKPVVEGRMLQALELTPDETVLEIGTGSGFITACLARLAKQVVSVDIYSDFTKLASGRCNHLGLDNVELFSGDVLRGWQPETAHDVVVVTGSVPQVPENFQGWVNPGGRLFVVRGHAPAMEAIVMTRVGVSEWRTESLFETELLPLVNAGEAARFKF